MGGHRLGASPQLGLLAGGRASAERRERPQAPHAVGMLSHARARVAAARPQPNSSRAM